METVMKKRVVCNRMQKGSFNYVNAIMVIKMNKKKLFYFLNFPSVLLVPKKVGIKSRKYFAKLGF